MRGCTAAGDLDDTQFSRPLPWVGLYIAGTSLLCAAFMALDTYSGFRRRRFWFPCRLFSLNAATLTLLGVATKFTVDLNTSMPRRVDQLTKLSGTVLICTAMCNFMPSLGSMDDAELLSNVVALAILVVTVIVNMGIQMGTGVIYALVPEHAIIMLLMGGILVVLVNSAMAVPFIKDSVKKDYDMKNPSDDDIDPDEKSFPLEWLETHVIKRHWLLNQTANGQCVVGRWASCTFLGASCFVAASVLTEALLRALFIRGPHLEFCSGTSDYGWSTIFVLVAQVVGVLIGTVGPTYRWLYDGYLRSRSRSGQISLSVFRKVAIYWAARLILGFEAVLVSPAPNIVLYFIVTLFFTLLIASMASMLGWGGLIAIGLVTLAVNLMWTCFSCIGSRLCTKTETQKASSNNNNPNLELEKYVVLREWEGHWAKQLKRWGLRTLQEWMENARKQQPTALVELIQAHSTISEGFKQVGAFDSGASSFPANGWALTVVTLAKIAVSLPGINQDLVDSLLRGVHEGLRFVRLVETNLDESFIGLQGRTKASYLWLRINLKRRWLGWNLHNSAPRDDSNGKDILEALAQSANKYATEFGSLLSDPDVVGYAEKLFAHRNVLAANCMHRICTTILGEYDSKHQRDDYRVFTWLRGVISDTLGACLTNLPLAVYMSCRRNYRTIEQEEKSIRDAAVLLMAAKGILKMLQDPQVSNLFPTGSTKYIDYWHRRGQMAGP